MSPGQDSRQNLNDKTKYPQPKAAGEIKSNFFVGTQKIKYTSHGQSSKTLGRGHPSPKNGIVLQSDAFAAEPYSAKPQIKP